ncbi:hypothetical protein KZI27_14190 [Curtobacterium sp. TC1]|uniref:hypothetical protein n=1 Tax=Curtobacterium sp. TC1 TaxID=2862880 RepID=UPI001C9AB151|nr:hypothetical protein [Curtobacterium sp. TC1]QZQ54452.1 hypothetical protein KZI27_14190 [Curtobacterium sp. TC1]
MSLTEGGVTYLVQESTGKQVQDETGEYNWEVETYPVDDLTALFERHRGLYRGSQDAWVAEVLKGEFLAQHIGVLIREATAEDMEKYATIFQRRKWADDWRNADAIAAEMKADRTARLVADFNENVQNEKQAARFFANTGVTTRDFLAWLKTAHQSENATVKLNDSALRAFEEFRTSRSPLAAKRLKGAAALSSIKETLGKKRAAPKRKVKAEAAG